MRHTIDLAELVRGRYEHVPAILRLDGEDIVQRPLRELRVRVGRSTVGRPVDAEVGDMRLVGPPSGLSAHSVEIPVRWRAREHPRLFPTMTGSLRITHAGPDAIELRLLGRYTPPLGPLGELADLVAGHEVVVASLRTVLVDVAGRLAEAISGHAPTPSRGRLRAPERSP
ncbi:MAG TPA: hypothetical protein VGU73_06470 [Acidimicrobiia bacterium]|nr:hypothetical protein [Acidimicrobiia bacterium]